jgi:hypothetical protein
MKKVIGMHAGEYLKWVLETDEPVRCVTCRDDLRGGNINFCKGVEAAYCNDHNLEASCWHLHGAHEHFHCREVQSPMMEAKKKPKRSRMLLHTMVMLA